MFTVVLALTQTPTFTNVCIRVRLKVCVFLSTVTLVYGIDASVKICVNSNMDNNTSTSANVCTHIFILILVSAVVSATLSVLDQHIFGNIDVGTSICIRISI